MTSKYDSSITSDFEPSAEDDEEADQAQFPTAYENDDPDWSSGSSSSFSSKEGHESPTDQKKANLAATNEMILKTHKYTDIAPLPEQIVYGQGFEVTARLPRSNLDVASVYLPSNGYQPLVICS